jgi:hypothetical protein
MDDSLDDFSDGASSDFAPPVKTAKVAKPKAAPKKAAAPAKPRGRPAGSTAAKPKAKAAPKKKAKDISDDENSDVDMEEDVIDDDESLLADTPKPKKAPAPKKASKPLADIENESFGMDGSEDAPLAKAKKAAGGASSKYQMVRSSPWVMDVTANVCAAYPFGTHHEASRHIHWLRRATNGQDVGLQFRERMHGVPRRIVRARSLQDFRRDLGQRRRQQAER